jgi:hypothetical protein
MIRGILAVLVAGSMSIGPAFADGCSSLADQSTFEVAALKSQLMVLATDCRTDTGYNAVVNKFRPQLIANDAELNAYFKQHFGSAAQHAHDAFITELANAQADESIKLGGDFCPRDAALFSEVMVLPDGKDLPAYAAAKDLLPPTLAGCVSPVPPPTRTASKRASKSSK